MKDFQNIRLPQGSYYFPKSGTNLPGIAIEDLVSFFLNKWGFPLINTCCYSVTPIDGQVMAYNAVTKKIEFKTLSGGGLGTNITNTPSSTGIALFSSTGTGSILPLATSTLSGLMSPTQFSKISNLPTSFPNITTNQVYFGNGSNVPTSSSDFTWNDTTKVLYINGKISMTGLIDPPTGLELQLRAANPGGVLNNTLWLNSTNNHLMRGSVDLENLGGSGTVFAVFGRTGAITPQSGDYVTTQVPEGTNLYYTNARAIGATLTGFVSGAGTITSSDTILTAIQKLSGNIAGSGSVANLALGTRTSTTLPITNSNGTGFTLPISTTSLAGLESAADKAKSDLITVTSAINLDTLSSSLTGKQNNLIFQEEGVATGSAGSVSTINFVGTSTTAVQVGSTLTITSTSSSSNVAPYSAGSGCIVKASATGVTFVRTTPSVWTFTIPAGVELYSHQIYSTSGENPGANVTINYNYTSNTVTNQDRLTMNPPDYTAWNLSAGADNQVVTGGSASTAFRPVLNSVGSGNISFLCTMGGGIGSAETLIKGVFQ